MRHRRTVTRLVWGQSFGIEAAAVPVRHSASAGLLPIRHSPRRFAEQFAFIGFGMTLAVEAFERSNHECHGMASGPNVTGFGRAACFGSER